MSEYVGQIRFTIWPASSVFICIYQALRDVKKLLDDPDQTRHSMASDLFYTVCSGLSFRMLE